MILNDFINSLSGLSADDFNGDDIYLSLLDIASRSAVDGAKAEKAAKARAKELGIKPSEFKSLYNCYKKDFSKGSTKPKPKPAEIDKSVLTVGEFTVYTDREAETFGVYLDDDVICHQVPLVAEISEDVDTGLTNVILSIHCRFGAPKKIECSKSTIVDSRQLGKLADRGLDVGSDSAAALARYFRIFCAENEDVIPTSSCVSHLGWCGEDFMPYAGGLHIVTNQLNSTAYSATSGDFDFWWSAVCPILVDAKAAIAIGTACVAPLLSIIGRSSFSLSTYGRTGCGKSVLMAVAASVWGNPHSTDGIIARLNTTANAVCGRLAFCRNYPVFYDETQLLKDMGARQKLAYSIESGQDRDRLNRKAELMQRGTWQTTVIFTGESPFLHENAGGGAVNRVFEMGFTDPLNWYDSPALTKLIQTVLANYGLLGRDCISIIKNTSAEEWKKTLDAYKGKLADDRIDGKQNEIMALIMLGFNEIFRRALIEFHGVSKFDVVPLSPSHVLGFAKTKEATDDRRRGFEYLTQQIAANDNCFSISSGDTPRERWGWYCDPQSGTATDDDDTTNCVAILTSRADKILLDGGFSTRTVMQWANENGLLIAHDPQKLSKRIRVGERKARCYCYCLNLSGTPEPKVEIGLL